ncbi:MAG: 50S ribosomal protein L31e [Candidatus Nezhaarchaeota archaeon]|nr:50S ribosomal protein L31e [Candidatus Nezhaarchaeota archaeon]
MERQYTIPLRIVLGTPRWRRAARAIRFVRTFVSRHMKSDDVKLDPKVSEIIWSRGAKKPPKKIKVKVVKYKDGSVKVEPV